MNFKKKLEVKRSIMRGGREVGNYVLMWNILREQVSMMETWKNFLGSKLHNGDVNEFLRNKLP